MTEAQFRDLKAGEKVRYENGSVTTEGIVIGYGSGASLGIDWEDGIREWYNIGATPEFVEHLTKLHAPMEPIFVKTRDDLPSPKTQVLMFQRGMGWRMGFVEKVCEEPWVNVEGIPGEYKPYRVALEGVLCYINLSEAPWPTDKKFSDTVDALLESRNA